MKKNELRKATNTATNFDANLTKLCQGKKSSKTNFLNIFSMISNLRKQPKIGKFLETSLNLSFDLSHNLFLCLA